MINRLHIYLLLEFGNPPIPRDHPPVNVPGSPKFSSYKNSLQEYCNKLRFNNPTYEIITHDTSTGKKSIAPAKKLTKVSGMSICWVLVLSTFSCLRVFIMANWIIFTNLCDNGLSSLPFHTAQ